MDITYDGYAYTDDTTGAAFDVPSGWVEDERSGGVVFTSIDDTAKVWFLEPYGTTSTTKTPSAGMPSIKKSMQKIISLAYPQSILLTARMKKLAAKPSAPTITSL